MTAAAVAPTTPATSNDRTLDGRRPIARSATAGAAASTTVSAAIAYDRARWIARSSWALFMLDRPSIPSRFAWL